VDADDALGVVEGEPRRDARADVPAVCAKAFVPQLLGHELRPQRGDPGLGHAAPPGLVREAAAGQRGHHHVEGVLRIGAVRGGIRQQRDELRHLEERARPAMRQDERQRPRALPALPDVMDPQTVHACAEVVERVQLLS
jgi:hypothetical protein